MESTSKAKMDALKQTIKSLRERRDHLEEVAATAQLDAQKQQTLYSLLEEKFKKEALHRTKLEEHLRSLGVEVDRYGNIRKSGVSKTPKKERMTNASPGPSSTAAEAVKQEDDVSNSLPSLPDDNARSVSNEEPEGPTPADIKVKKGKKDDFPQPLPLDVRARFLKGASLFPIDPDPLPVAVGRYALNKTYGSGTVAMSWTKDEHRFLWPSYDWNPDMPRGVGEPGLLLEVHPIYCDGNQWTLFYKVRQSNPALWAYAGEYTGREAGKLWKEEYAALGEVVHTTRAQQMLRNRSPPDAGSEWQRIKARIVLRKQLPPGVEPTEEQVEAELPNLALHLSQEYSPDYLTCQDITDAFIRGDEHLVVSRLECVGYDHAKAKEFIEVQERYLKLKGKKKRKLPQKRKGTTPDPPLDNAESDSSDSEEESSHPAKRTKSAASSKPQPSNSTATSLPPTPSSSRSVRVRIKSRKLLELD